MIPRPRDFTLGQFTYKSTPPGQPPTDDDLLRTVTQGLPASAMPYFGDLLTDPERRAVVDYVKSLSSAFAGPAPTPIAVPPRVAPDAASVARGKALYTAQGCGGCHGADGRGGVELKDAKGYPVISRDLTAPWTFRGGSDPRDVWLRLTTGLAPSPMPSFANLSPEQRWDLVNYVLSFARTPPWQPGGTFGGFGTRTDPVMRGRYLVHFEMCGLCHTQIDQTGIYRDDAYLAGGMKVLAYPQGVFVTRNLAGDASTGVGRWSPEQVAAAIRDGRAPDRLLDLFDMPWQLLHDFTPEDATAIGAYLRTLTPVSNQIPPPLGYGVVETIVQKLRYSQGVPPLGNPRALTYVEGNFGATSAGLLPRGWLQPVLIDLQGLVLVFGVVAYVFARPAGRRLPRSFLGCLGAVFAVLGLLLVGVIGWVVDSTPNLPFLPPDLVAQGPASTIPRVDPARFATPEQAAMAERGRYLFTVASCALCHTDDGSGGYKLSWRQFGTIYSANLTSDRATGLGSWTDAEIARAIRSGIAKDGRPIHWQAMIWDHLSNLDEEDLRAIVAYLRTLPPVHKAIPAPRPPAADDCPYYTFFLNSPDRIPGPGCG